MDEQACAHIHVGYRCNEETPGHFSAEWWECLQCSRRFEPSQSVQILKQQLADVTRDKNKLENEAEFLNQELDDLTRQLNNRASDAKEYQIRSEKAEAEIRRLREALTDCVKVLKIHNIAVGAGGTVKRAEAALAAPSIVQQSKPYYPTQ